MFLALNRVRCFVQKDGHQLQPSKNCRRGVTSLALTVIADEAAEMPRKVGMPLSALTPAPARMKTRSVGETLSINGKCTRVQRLCPSVTCGRYLSRSKWDFPKLRFCLKRKRRPSPKGSPFSCANLCYQPRLCRFSRLLRHLKINNVLCFRQHGLCESHFLRHSQIPCTITSTTGTSVIENSAYDNNKYGFAVERKSFYN
jgi:hypothetical protein